MKKTIIYYRVQTRSFRILLPYDGSALKKCARFTESITKIIQPSKYRIILFENLCNLLIMLDWKILITITNNTTKFLKISPPN
jgi:hypothetical protein